MTAVFTIGAEPVRDDVDVIPGELVDFTVPVLNAAGAVQDVTLWAVSAHISASRDSVVLHTLDLTPGATGVRVTATEADTAGWVDWPVPSALWQLWGTPPGGRATPIARGWFRIQ